MAANPVARYCSCGCGVSIDHLRWNSVRTPACQTRHDAHQSVLNKRAKRLASRPPRFCRCGCGRSIDHLKSIARTLPECKQLARKMYEQVVSRPRRTRARRVKPYISSVTPFMNTAAKKMPGEAPYVPTIHCKECWGLPHRRPYMWRCKGCAQQWAPEERPEQSLLRSSAGTTADASKLWGHKVKTPGDADLKTFKLPAAIRDKSSNFAGWRRIKKGKADGKV